MKKIRHLNFVMRLSRAEMRLFYEKLAMGESIFEKTIFSPARNDEIQNCTGSLTTPTSSIKKGKQRLGAKRSGAFHSWQLRN